jgi:oligoribonuclease NrnB/cAMP/cGMP phosphodiesterase (DHH superfamily)
LKSLPLDGLQHAVVHANCTDGLASAIVLKLALPHLKVTHVNYHTPELECLMPEPGMIFCDFCPPESRAQDFFDQGAVVLDHHRTVKNIVQKFQAAGLGAFGDESRDPGVSGAVLAYRHVYRPLLGEGPQDLQDFVTKVGVRDTWRRDSPFWAEAQKQHLLFSFFTKDEWMPPGETPRYPPNLPNKSLGDVLQDHLEAKIQSQAKKSIQIKVGRYTFCLMPSLSTSDVVEYLGPSVDALFGFAYDREEIRVSCRSHSGFDVGALAKSLGGGGHTQASGFSIPKSEVSPYKALTDILTKWVGP